MKNERESNCAAFQLFNILKIYYLMLTNGSSKTCTYFIQTCPIWNFWYLINWKGKKIIQFYY